MDWGRERIQRGSAYPTSGAVQREGNSQRREGNSPARGGVEQMGKYMRKCRGAMGEEVAAMEVTQVVGVRTRSRSASASAAKVATSKRRKAALPPAPVTPQAGDSSLAAPGENGSCYLKLRSRMLFMAPPPAPAPAAMAEAAGASQGPVLVGGISRCSSTASSVDASASMDKGLLCHPEASKAGGDHIPEGSASNSENGRDRERRETTPSSHLPGEISDLESDLAGQDRSRPLPAIRTAVQQAARAIVPPAAEIEEFFAAAEEAEVKRFAAKYNFDVVRGVPLDGGRFEWTPAVGSS